MKLPAYRTALLFFLFGVLSCGPAMSAPASFEIDTKELPKPAAAHAGKRVDAKKLEIDLNELRAELARKAKAGKSAKAVKKRGKAKSRLSTASVAASGEYSHYTVQRGDHIALILVRHYGLKESEAHKLVPEVMRLNSIRSPKSVAAGKKLLIPLPAPGAKPLATRQVVVAFTTPCALGLSLLEKLDMVQVSKPQQGDARVFGAGYAGANAMVVCSPDQSERITFERFTALYGEQLVVLEGNEDGRQVVESLAHGLGLSYRRADDAASGEPAYVFNHVDADNGEYEIRVLLKGVSK